MTVIVVNWNGERFLSRCLAALRQQSFHRFSTILVDNGSTDGSIALVEKEFPEVRIVALSKNIGFSAANNVVLKHVKTEFVALINNDAIAHENWLENLTQALQSHPQAGFAASKMVFSTDPHRIDRAGDAYTLAGAGALRGRGTPSHHYNQKEWVFGACAGAALYCMHMLDDIGVFDEDFFLLYEDVDLSFRAQLMGYRCLYVPGAVVYHLGTQSIGYDSARSVYYGHRNLEWTYWQNMPSQLILRTIGPHLLYTLFAFFYFCFIGQGRAYISAKLDAARGLGRCIRKRRQVQAGRRVSSGYIRGLLSPENFGWRLNQHLRSSK